MAERVAHLTATLQPTPSIFEVVASDSLNATFHPALKRVANFFALRDPIRFGWLETYYEEVFFVLNFLIQAQYLKHYGGTLSDVFYGFSLYSTKTQQLSIRDQYLTHFCVAVVPYIRTKLEKKLNQWQEESRLSNENIRIKEAAVKGYQTLVTCYECLKLAQYVLFVARKSRAHTPILRALGLGVRYLPPDDQHSWTWSDLFSGKTNLAALMSSGIFRCMEYSAFFLQFVQWWQTAAPNKNLFKLPMPPAPEVEYTDDKYMGKCPICLQKLVNPTAISVSGYVYCFQCIVYHFNDHQTCPVTNYPATIDDLIKIHE